MRSLKDTLQAAAETARSGKADKSARISFASPELLWNSFTAKRWEILKALTGAGSLSIRKIARRVELDVKAVHCTRKDPITVEELRALRRKCRRW